MTQENRANYKLIIRREYLKLLRMQRKITAPVMAEKLRLSCRQHYLRYENGERDIGPEVSFAYFLTFSEIFELPISFFEQAESDYRAAKEVYYNEISDRRKAKRS